MSEQEIKACPCCSGGVGMVWTRHAFDVSYEPVVSYKVQCRECRLSTKDYDSEAEAIAAWNQRAGEAELASLRALREAAQYVQDRAMLDPDREIVEVPYGPAIMLRDRLAACDEASAAKEGQR